MTAEEMELLERHLVAQLRKWRMRGFFPDEGELRRELYTRHLAFFRAGATYRERLFMAGNRCITPWTPVEMGRATRRADEMLGVDRFDVLSWDGDFRSSRPAEGVFLKGIEPAFRVLLDSGEWFDCSREHRLLAASGWTSLGQLVRASSGLRCWQTPQGLTASCEPGSSLGGGRPLSPPGIDPGQPRRRADAPGRSPSCSSAGAWVPTPGRSHLDPAAGHQPSLDDPDLIGDLCGQFEDPAEHIAAQWPTDTLRALQRSGRELALSGLDPEAIARRLSSASSLGIEWIDGCSTGSAPNSCNPAAVRFPSRGVHRTSVEGFFARESQWQIFVPCQSPAVVGLARIVAIVNIGCQPIIDFTVPSTACYVAGGVVHHNTGKTIAGSYESALHLTGLYPHWWEGRRFDKPVRWWACGSTLETTRDIVQYELLGPKDDLGTGMIPASHLGEPRFRPNTNGACDFVAVRHVSGGDSLLGFKSFDQGRKAFEGTAKEGVWLDEEPPQAIYTECLTRTATTKGIVMVTFTPLNGATDVVMDYIENADLVT